MCKIWNEDVLDWNMEFIFNVEIILLLDIDILCGDIEVSLFWIIGVRVLCVFFCWVLLKIENIYFKFFRI